MTTLQKVIKYSALALAVFLCVSIIGGILSLFGLFGGFFANDAVLDETKLYEISSDIKNLSIDINAADLNIKQGEKFSVLSNLKYLNVEQKGDILFIKEVKKLNRNYNGAVLTVYIPKDTVFDSLNIDAGAGTVTADFLSANSLEFDFGAGKVEINSLIANGNADIEGGAGKITISGGSLNNLNFEMGVGELNLTSELTGRSEFDLGVGEANITVIGSKDDYRLYIDKGIGNITLNGENVSSANGEGNGINILDIDGGVGSVNLKFK